MGGGGNAERFLFRLSRRCPTHGKIMESRAQIGIVSSFFPNHRILFTNRLMFPIIYCHYYLATNGGSFSNLILAYVHQIIKLGLYMNTSRSF